MNGNPKWMGINKPVRNWMRWPSRIYNICHILIVKVSKVLFIKTNVLFSSRTVKQGSGNPQPSPTIPNLCSYIFPATIVKPCQNSFMRRQMPSPNRDQRSSHQLWLGVYHGRTRDKSIYINFTTLSRPSTVHTNYRNLRGQKWDLKTLPDPQRGPQHIFQR